MIFIDEFRNESCYRLIHKIQRFHNKNTIKTLKNQFQNNQKHIKITRTSDWQHLTSVERTFKKIDSSII